MQSIILYLEGTMDIHTVKVVSVHIEAMLPPTGIELDLDVIVEPAALLSLGFLYQGTAHRHISQVLLQEIGVFFFFTVNTAEAYFSFIFSRETSGT